MVEQQVHEVQAGGWHLRPRNKVHTFWNASERDARIIDICIPGGHESCMRELAVLFERDHRPTPTDLEALASRHDIQFRFDALDAVIREHGVRL